MRKTAIAGAVVAALALASCATQGDKAPVSSLRFSYTTEGGKAIGLVRAFDDGERTALQFVTDPPTALQVFDGEESRSLTSESARTPFCRGCIARCGFRLAPRPRP